MSMIVGRGIRYGRIELFFWASVQLDVGNTGLDIMSKAPM